MKGRSQVAVMSSAVTTTLHPEISVLEKAAQAARDLLWPCIPREKNSLEKILRQNNLHGLLVIGKHKNIYTDGRTDLFFHPGMAKLRIKEILAGKTDQMIKAMDLQPGDVVLDCTLGLAADAIVAAFVVGETGSVTGLESSSLLVWLVKDGQATYQDKEMPHLNLALRRIKVQTADHLTYLSALPPQSVDVVYFDPMFRHPLQRSSSMLPVRRLADHRPVSPEAIREALRVARKRVVLKETRNSGEFERLGFHEVSGGKYAPVTFGIIRKA